MINKKEIFFTNEIKLLLVNILSILVKINFIYKYV